MVEETYDAESQKPHKIPHIRQVIEQGAITEEVLRWDYEGKGTEEDPYRVVFIDHDPRNPMLYSPWKKWSLVMLVAIATLAVSFVSSAYSGGVQQIILQFQVSEEVAILGVSLFVLGFAIGPLLWAPLSELYGRQYLFVGTYMALTAFNAGGAGAKNSWTLIILRFFAGAFGSSPLTNAGGVIADMFNADERGLAMSLFAAAPFLGPTLGPIVGGFVGETIGWRWLEGIMAIFSGVVWLVGLVMIPETYPPVLLRRRAETLSRRTGKVYRSQLEAEQGRTSLGQAYKTSLSRPWILLFREPIVLLLSVYMAIIYGTLYLMFAAFPIVYQQYRHWSEGIGGLAFLGVMVGMMLAVLYSIWDNKRYVKVAANDPSGYAPPEARLPPCLIGAVCLPVGLFWFAWTNSPTINWAPSILAGIPFGAGMVLVFLSIMNYLIDSYVIFAASVLAANSVLRSLMGAIFPLFTTYMYRNLGIHWASSIPAFLALACVPFPFIFYKVGYKIRRRCRFAAEADSFLRKMRGQVPPEEEEGDSASVEAGRSLNALEKKDEGHDQRAEEREQEAFDYNYEEDCEKYEEDRGARFQKIRTGQSLRHTASRDYELSPFDLDRMNTKESFKRSRSASRASNPSLKSKKSVKSLKSVKS